MTADPIPVEVYVEGETVHVRDHNGPGTIPARVVHLLAHTATQRGRGEAKWSGRMYGRDLLTTARDLVDQREACTFADQHTSCDELATTTDLHDRRVCDRHAPDDDKDA